MIQAIQSKLVWSSLLLVALLTTSIQAADSPEPSAQETPAQRDARMQWWREARFGMFIHWGVYSVPAGEYGNNTTYGEWIMESAHIPTSIYEKYANQFDPEKFNAREWARLARQAGMKYVVITSKHHDGFGMWPSKVGDWNIGRTPFKRDPLKELAAACKAEGIKFCLYHSIMDWHQPDYEIRRPWNDTATGTPDMNRYMTYLKGQLHELLTGYGPIGLLWFDGEWESAWNNERGSEIYNYVRSLQPQLIVNNRVGHARNGMAGTNKGAGVGDYETPEQEIPATGFGAGVDWESCMTMNDHWGYNKQDQNWKSTTQLVRNLIDCASKGGNYLLNVGPTSEGLIPGPSIERLEAIGAWMKVNGPAIYDTSASPFKKLAWGRCTKKVSGDQTTLYLHVFNWPADGQLVVPGLHNVVKSARLLADGQKLKFSNTPEGVSVTVPASAPDPISATVVLKIQGAPEVTAVLIQQASDGTVSLVASEAELQGALAYETGGGKDNIGYWINPADTASWAFQVRQPGQFTVVADIAALGAGPFEIKLGEQTLRGTAPITGDYAKFQTLTLTGTVAIRQPGLVTLTVHPVAEGWQSLNLRSLRLVPTGQ